MVVINSRIITGALLQCLTAIVENERLSCLEERRGTLGNYRARINSASLILISIRVHKHTPSPDVTCAPGLLSLLPHEPSHCYNHQVMHAHSLLCVLRMLNTSVLIIRTERYPANILSWYNQ